MVLTCKGKVPHPRRKQRLCTVASSFRSKSSPAAINFLGFHKVLKLAALLFEYLGIFAILRIRQIAYRVAGQDHEVDCVFHQQQAGMAACMFTFDSPTPRLLQISKKECMVLSWKIFMCVQSTINVCTGSIMTRQSS